MLGHHEIENGIDDDPFMNDLLGEDLDEATYIPLEDKAYSEGKEAG